MNSQKIETALQIALNAHYGQTRNSGEPYIFHPMRVAQTVLETYNDFSNVEVPIEDAVIIALLHDTLEDTSLTFAQIETEFGFDVAINVLRLSRLPGGDGKKPPYAEFIESLKAYKITRLVKLADLKDNLRDAHKLPPEKQGIEKKYRRAKVTLESPRVTTGIFTDFGSGQESAFPANP